jgi:hypothetical protein
MKAVARRRLIGLVLLAALTAGCVSLTPAGVPVQALDDGSNNGWEADPANSTGVSGGWTQKQAVNAYLDDADDDRGHPGRMSVHSLRTLLSPDREELRDRVRTQLRENAENNGLELESQTSEGQRELANGARSYYVGFNATAQTEGSVFASDAEVRILGEVFRCTGGATVVVTGSAQVSESESVGGVQTSEDRDPRTWAEIVRDPQGTIDGHRGQGLVYRIACGG